MTRTATVQAELHRVEQRLFEIGDLHERNNAALRKARSRLGKAQQELCDHRGNLELLEGRNARLEGEFSAFKRDFPNGPQTIQQADYLLQLQRAFLVTRQEAEGCRVTASRKQTQVLTAAQNLQRREVLFSASGEQLEELRRAKEALAAQLHLHLSDIQAPPDRVLTPGKTKWCEV